MRLAIGAPVGVLPAAGPPSWLYHTYRQNSNYQDFGPVSEHSALFDAKYI